MKATTPLISILLALYVVVNLSDYLVTLLGLRWGFTEGNPIPSVVPLFQFKLLSIALVVGGVIFATQRKWSGVALLIAGLSLFSACLVLWNLWVVIPQ